MNNRRGPNGTSPDCDLPNLPWGGMSEIRTRNTAIPCDQRSGVNDVFRNPCDPSPGISEKYHRRVGTASLSEAINVTDIPIRYMPIAEAQAAAGNADQTWTTVVSQPGYKGYYARAVRLHGSLKSGAEWSNAVEWALFIGDQMDGDPWLGDLDVPLWQYLSREGVPGIPVNLRARVRQPYWNAAVGADAQPVFNLFSAVGILEVWYTENREPC